MYEKGSLRLGMSTKETNIDDAKEQMKYSDFSLTGEISRYMNISCVRVSKILRDSVDGITSIVEAVNRHNEILDDVIIPQIFHVLFEVVSTQKSEDVEVVLLREPKNAEYYEFSAKDELVITKDNNNFTRKEIAKSFHADTYCFDSKPERECFLQYISVIKLKKCILRECLHRIKEIYQFNIMILNQEGFVSIIRISWLLWKMEHISLSK